jgi:hypothetical protein
MSIGIVFICVAVVLHLLFWLNLDRIYAWIGALIGALLTKPHHTNNLTMNDFITVASELEAPSPKRSKPFVMLTLCAVFALGGIAGAIGGCAAAGRYQLLQRSDTTCFRVDKLTGKTWFVNSRAASPIQER